MPIYESGEDYLETIYLLGKKKSGVHAVDVATELGFSKPSVTKAMNILKKNGYIVIDESNHIILTKTGTSRAEEVYARHCTVTVFLMSLGVSAETAEKDACRIEHIISAETFERIKERTQKRTEV